MCGLLQVALYTLNVFFFFINFNFCVVFQFVVTYINIIIYNNYHNCHNYLSLHAEITVAINLIMYYSECAIYLVAMGDVINRKRYIHKS